MDKTDLESGDILQIDPEQDDVFGGCLMVVSEPKTWGAQGYVCTPGREGGAYSRWPGANMEMVGRAGWVLGDTCENS